MTVNLTGTASLSTLTDSNGNYSFTAPAGGSYTLTPSLSGYTFSPGSSSFSKLSANETANFSLASTLGDSNPDPAPAYYPDNISSPPSPPAGSCNITGTWTDQTFSYQLQQVNAAVTGSVTVNDAYGCGTFQVSIQGQSTGSATYSLNMTAPEYDPCRYPVEPTNMSVTMTLSSCSEADVTPSGAGASGYLPGSGGGSGGGETWYLAANGLTFKVSAPAQVPIPGAANNAQMLLMSTGDTPQITTTASLSTYPVDAVYVTALQANPHGGCNASLGIGDGQGTGSATSNVSAAPDGCSGIFGVWSAVGGTTTQNAIEIVFPPQILIQMLYGEAHGQAASGDAVSEQAIGAVVRNRFGDTAYFSGVETYQGAITPGPFLSIRQCQASGTCVQTGTTPELSNAALVYGGVTTSAMNVANAKCFFSPDANGWSAIQAALGNSKVTVVPSVDNDPGCFTVEGKENEQFVYKSSIANNANGSGAPAFIFVQYKKSSDPAAIQIP